MKNFIIPTQYSKYGNFKTLYNGIMYDSKLEAKYAQQLDLRLRGRDIKHWSRQVKFPIVVNGEKICTYICDFQIFHNDGSMEFVEVKGNETKEWKLKKKLILATFFKEHPKYKFTVLTIKDIDTKF